MSEKNFEISYMEVCGYRIQRKLIPTALATYVVIFDRFPDNDQDKLESCAASPAARYLDDELAKAFVMEEIDGAHLSAGLHVENPFRYAQDVVGFALGDFAKIILEQYEEKYGGL